MFSDLFAHNDQANRDLIQVITEHRDQTTDRALSLMGHILNAHHIWNARILKKEATQGVWDLVAVDALLPLHETDHRVTLEIIESTSMHGKVDHTNSKGQTFSNEVRDILMHIIIHSNYHRGQVASEMKQYGVQPPVMDYIAFRRKMAI